VSAQSDCSNWIMQKEFSPQNKKTLGMTGSAKAKGYA
jgi:hypothetical protein